MKKNFYNVYSTDFVTFLQHSNEKEILLHEITKIIKKYNVRTLLDIGAGDGMLAIPLSKKVSRYKAIESNPIFCENLGHEGLNVYEAFFPVDLQEKFDLVLASHVVSYTKKKFQPFIDMAWRHVKPGGLLLIVTYRGKDDDWTHFMRNLGYNVSDRNRIGYNDIIMYLHSCGSVKTRQIVTQVFADNILDFLVSLSFVFSTGDRNKKIYFSNKLEKISKYLDSKYKTEDGYCFLFQHFLISCIK